jgi:hypothetical protein
MLRKASTGAWLLSWGKNSHYSLFWNSDKRLYYPCSETLILLLIVVYLDGIIGKLVTLDSHYHHPVYHGSVGPTEHLWSAAATKFMLLVVASPAWYSGNAWKTLACVVLLENSQPWTSNACVCFAGQWFRSHPVLLIPTSNSCHPAPKPSEASRRV